MTVTKKNAIMSHMLLSDVFTMYSINRLVKLFTSGTIAKYVQEERAKQNLNDAIVTSYVYGTNDNNTTLYLQIKKYGKGFIHLTIHMAPDTLPSKEKHSGIAHIFKDVYYKKKSNNSAPDNYVTGGKKYLLYATYRLEHLHDKPNSIHFTITHGYSTPTVQSLYKGFIDDVAKYDTDVKKEMDVITNVLNRLFDEDDIDYYVGNYHNKYPHATMNQNQPAIEVDNIPNGNHITHSTHLSIKIQTPVEINNALNDILEDMNKRTLYIRRQNAYIPVIKDHNNQSVYPSNYIRANKRITTNKKKNTQASHMKLYTPKQMRKQNRLHTNKTGNNSKSKMKLYTPKRRIHI